MATPVDIIPDLHADPERMARILDASQGRSLAFLGDFIDAGRATVVTDDLQVLTQVRTLIESGTAIAVMGNHELNAILYHRLGRDGAPLRPHSDKNRGQHASFLDRFGLATDAALHWTDWFMDALPLWHDAQDYRLVHACWNAPAIRLIAARRPDGRLRPADLEEVADKSTPFGAAVELLLSGPELRLPRGFQFADYSKNERHYIRMNWWKTGPSGWRDLALSVPDPSTLPSGDISPQLIAARYPADAPPVFVGHYKMHGTPRIEAENALCLDYPQTPCLYRWQGETVLTPKHLFTFSM